MVLGKLEKTRIISKKEEKSMKIEEIQFLSYNIDKEKGFEGETMRDVYRLIRKLGATSKYKGYYYVAEAVHISMRKSEFPIKITKEIYPYLARKFKSKPMNIEHDIRTVINVCWITNKETLDLIAGFKLIYKPTNSEFIDMLAYYLLQKEEADNKKL